MQKYSLPPLKEIVALQTEEDALEYLLENGFIRNRENNRCRKQNTTKTSNGRTILLDPCEGRLAYPRYASPLILCLQLSMVQKL